MSTPSSRLLLSEIYGRRRTKCRFAASPNETETSDEAALSHRLESCCRMLSMTMSHFWYRRWWHHLEIRLRVKRTSCQNRGSKCPACCQAGMQTRRVCFEIQLRVVCYHAPAAITWQSHKDSSVFFFLPPRPSFKYVNKLKWKET